MVMELGQLELHQYVIAVSHRRHNRLAHSRAHLWVLYSLSQGSSQHDNIPSTTPLPSFPNPHPHRYPHLPAATPSRNHHSPLHPGSYDFLTERTFAGRAAADAKRPFALTP